MAKPIVAIVGRPNVGKSTLFNYLVGRRVSIVDDRPGVTRDRIYGDVEWRGVHFTIIDTGGIETDSIDEIKVQMRFQAELAIDTSDVILFMVDLRTGLMSQDEDIAEMLRASKKPVVVVVNKSDRVGETPAEFYEFYNIGFDEVVPLSSAQGLGMGDMLDIIYGHFDKSAFEEDEGNIIKVAVVGRPNVGKSSLINNILGEDRVIVSNIPGTTRDAIDTYFEKDGQQYMLTDTAGIRRKSRIDDDIEWYSTVRAWAAIDRSDVCIVMVDAGEGSAEQDTKIAGYAHDNGKASIIAVNKWDTVEKETNTMEEMRKEVQKTFNFMTYAPVMFFSALTGQRVNKLFDMIKFVADQNAMRITTGMLNELLAEAVAMVQPPSDKGKRLKIYYITQVSVKPPTFVAFINNKDLFHYSYARYLENQLRKSFGFEGTPIRIIPREKEND